MQTTTSPVKKRKSPSVDLNVFGDQTEQYKNVDAPTHHAGMPPVA